MKVTRTTSTILFALALSGMALRAEENAPAYLDPSVPRDARIQDLISRMTLEEKASMMKNTTPGVPRLHIPKYDWWSEALHGVANAGRATSFPQAIGLAAMWDESLQREIAGVIGVEARAKFNGYAGTPVAGTTFHGLTFWSPNINIFRDPRWGRGQETYGEDPFLTARLGVAFVRGLQGDNPDYLVAAACEKHFAVHSGPEPLRHGFDVAPSKADLYETYLPAFEALVREGRVEIVMTAYNSLDGTPCSINPLLYGLLAKWGFDGHVTSDCGSVADLSRSYRRAKDDAEAEAMTIKAGMNVRCGSEPTAIVEAVRRGLVTEAEVDARLRPLLRTMFRLGFFDPANRVPYNRISPRENESPEHGAVALQAARESMVLLRNDGVLPLARASLHTVAVIGPNATSVPALLGNYNGQPSAPVTILAGIRAALEPAGVKVVYAHGCEYSTRPGLWHLIPQPWYRAEYFANPDLSGEPVASRVERPLCFECNVANGWGGLPDGVPPRGASVRWRGELQTTLPGAYQFRVRGRGGFRLMVDHKRVVDAWISTPAEAGVDREKTGSCELPDNATVPIMLEYVQGDGPMKAALDWITPTGAGLEAEAVEAAKNSDVVIFVGGISAQLEGEEMQVDFDGYSGGDRRGIELPSPQQRLLEKLHATGKPLVYVNLSGSAVAMPGASGHANAILQAWYPGQAGGTAVADVLLGTYNPAGRLPVTFYRSTSDLPEFTNYDMANRTYRYFKGTPLYPFGHGLSYTQFDYSNLQVERRTDGDVSVSVVIKNAGRRDGDEVVQLYAVPPPASHPRETEALCGFRRLHLAEGETRTVTIVVPASALRRWSTEKDDYEIPQGEWTIRAGASSADIRQSSPLKL